MTPKPSETNNYCVDHISLLSASFKRVTGRALIDSHLEGGALAKAVYEAPFALVSHGTEDDPVFNYGNQTALDLFGMGWEEFVSLPSRFSAEQPNREERQRLLDEVSTKGCIDNYSGRSHR